MYPLKKETDKVVRKLSKVIQTQCGLVESVGAVQNYNTFIHYRLYARTGEALLQEFCTLREEVLGAVSSYQATHTVSHFSISKSVNLRRPGEITLLLYLSRLNTVRP